VYGPTAPVVLSLPVVKLFESLVNVCSQIRPPLVVQSDVPWTIFLTSHTDSSASQGSRPTWQPPSESKRGCGPGQKKTSLRDPGDDTPPPTLFTLLVLHGSTPPPDTLDNVTFLPACLYAKGLILSLSVLLPTPCLCSTYGASSSFSPCDSPCPASVGVEHFCGIEVPPTSVDFCDSSWSFPPSSSPPSFYASMPHCGHGSHTDI
jgi:hypothetical protein